MTDLQDMVKSLNFDALECCNVLYNVHGNVANANQAFIDTKY